MGPGRSALVELLATLTPAATSEAVWGANRMRLAAYPGAPDPPSEFVTSVRSLVVVDGTHAVVCTNAGGRAHPWPGGVREPGETFAQTAVREIHEETGWHLDPTSLRPLGWIHVHNLDPAHPRFAHQPWPDFVHLVLAGAATERDGGRDADWTDVEGWELSSRLVPLADLVEATASEPLARPFLELLR
jgi:8-oxo-dGTP pyrophosphatase MutT (NUDIX family)